MDDTPLVSIVLCTYNGEKYIKEQVDSLLNQTYQNLEIIICDDSSKDNTALILQDFNDIRIKCFYNKQNMGLAKNKEQCMMKASGDFIASCDQDDIWMPNKIECLITNIGDCTLIYSKSTIVDEDLNIPNVDNNPILYKGNNYKVFWFHNYVSGHTMLFKKSMLKHILPLPTKYVYPDHWISYICTANGSITYVDKSLVYYRQHSSQITKTQKNSFGLIGKLFYKIVKKDIKRRKEIEQRRNILNTISKYNLTNQEDQKLLEDITKCYSKLLYQYFGIKLYFLLNKNKDSLFGNYKRMKSIFSLSKGLWFNRINLIVFLVILITIINQ